MTRSVDFGCHGVRDLILDKGDKVLIEDLRTEQPGGTEFCLSDGCKFRMDRSESQIRALG